jgi:hypothetical protein
LQHEVSPGGFKQASLSKLYTPEEKASGEELFEKVVFQVPNQIVPPVFPYRRSGRRPPAAQDLETPGLMRAAVPL